MTWVYPAEEAAVTTRAGLSVASFWVAVLFILGGVATLITHSALNAEPPPLLGLAGFALLAALLGGARVAVRLWNRRGVRHRVWTQIVVAVLFLLAMSAAVGTLGHQLDTDPDSPAFPANAIVIAAIALGGIVDRWTGALGSLTAYGLAQGALTVSAPDLPPEPNPAVVAVVIAIYYAFLAAVRRRGRDAAGLLDDAVRADFAATQRRAFELRSRALVHDTVLSELVAVGLGRPGPLSAASRASIAESLAAVRGPDDAETYAARPSRALDAVLARERSAGLDVEVTGDAGILEDLPAPARAAMLQAIDQSLVNVRKHAGVAVAEVSVIESGASVVVAVVDDGVGFSEAEIPADRFGFRESIRGALESVGGSARILSGSGAGTSIILTVPQGPAS